MRQETWQKWTRNLVMFTAPALAIFFYQLSQGVEFKTASTLAILAFYGAAADLFRKWSNE